MGRSVNYLSNAIQICYSDVSWMGMEQVAECSECGEYYYHPYQDSSEKDDTECCGVKLHYEDIYREGHDDWDWGTDDMTYQFKEKFPSLYTCSRYEHSDETSIILENSFIEIGVSEYCGLASISMRILPDIENAYYAEDRRLLGLATTFANRVATWMGQNIGDLRSVGRFSNGEHVLERKEQ